MIPVPYHRTRRRNLTLYGEGQDNCLLCGKPIKTPFAAVHLGNGGSHLVTDAEACADPAGDMYWHSVGRDCWKKHPEIHAYGHTWSKADEMVPGDV